MNYKPEDAVVDDLKFWAKTNKGEYVFDANFGLDIRRYLFEPKNILVDNVLQNAKEQLPIYFPDLKALKIEVLTSDEIQEINEELVVFKFEGYIKPDRTRFIKIEEFIG